MTTLYATCIFRNIKTSSLCLVRLIIESDGSGLPESSIAKWEFSTNGEDFKKIKDFDSFSKKWKYLEIKP